MVLLGYTHCTGERRESLPNPIPKGVTDHERTSHGTP